MIARIHFGLLSNLLLSLLGLLRGLKQLLDHGMVLLVASCQLLDQRRRCGSELRVEKLVAGNHRLLSTLLDKIGVAPAELSIGLLERFAFALHSILALNQQSIYMATG